MLNVLELNIQKKKMKGNKNHFYKDGRTLKAIIYEVLKGRPFCNCSNEEQDLYDAWCLRIAETVDIYLEELE